jgi:hypothetical protein
MRQTGTGKVHQVAAASVITAVAVAGCTGHAKTAHETVTGTFLMVGGPANYTNPNGTRVPLRGHVTATSIAGARFTVSTGKSGRFTMLLPPGTYQLAGYPSQVHADSHQISCSALHPVQVKAGKSTRGIEVVCPVP